MRHKQEHSEKKNNCIQFNGYHWYWDPALSDEQ